MTFNFDSLADRSSKATRPVASPTARRADEDEKPRRRALLVGQPNVGKSVVFGALTGTYVTVSNYPGTTVEITRGCARFGADLWEIVDTPGTHNLVPMSEDEAVTRDILVSETHDALVQVGDAKNLARTLLLTLQLGELGLPFCLDLNMLDEARSRGLSIDMAALQLELEGLPVNASTAIEGEGLDGVREYLGSCADEPAGAQRTPLGCAPRFPEDVEAAIADVEARLEAGLPVAKRAIATMLLGGERGVGGAVMSRIGADAKHVAQVHAAALARAHGAPVFALLSRLRLARAQAIVRRVQTRDVRVGPHVHAGNVTWARALALGVPASFIAALVYDGAVARNGGVTASDPLADYGFFAVTERLLSRDVFSGWSAAGIALFAVATCLATLLVRRSGRARGGAWKLVGAFAVGWFAYFVLSSGEAIARHAYTSIPVHVGAIAGLASLAVAVRAGDRRDAALSSAIGRAATHPIWGFAVLAVVLLLSYKIVGQFGAGTAVDFVENGIFGSVVASAPLDRASPGGTEDESGDAEGQRRLVVVADGSSRVIVSAEVKHGASYVIDRDARIDVTGRGAIVSRLDGGRVAVQGHLSGAEARIWTGHLNRWAYEFFVWVGVPLLTAFFVGPYGLVTMGITYAVAIVLPVVATFFFVFSMLEDSGYLPRLAVMANRSLRSMGLNGRAVLPMVLGLGCDTMATLTARIMETRKERTLVTLLLAIGIPCSSQLSVIFALMQRTSRVATLVWLGVVIGTLLSVGWVAARVLPGDTSDFLLEMPPIRRPMVGNLVTKTMARIEWYLREAVPLFLAGTALLFILDAAHLLGVVHRVGEPIVFHVLGFRRTAGIADRVSEALLVGFLRRDFGAAGLLELARAGRLSPADVAVSMVTITLFIPCIANVFMIAKERGWKAATMMSGFIFPYAIAVGALVRLGFRICGG
jgi:Fe2+ transport system protein B